MKILILFYPIIKSIFEIIVKQMKISEENKKKLFDAINAVDCERSLPAKHKKEIKDQIDSFSNDAKS